jgi:hypothetical protein
MRAVRPNSPEAPKSRSGNNSPRLHVDTGGWRRLRRVGSASSRGESFLRGTLDRSGPSGGVMHTPGVKRGFGGVPPGHRRLQKTASASAPYRFERFG